MPKLSLVKIATFLIVGFILTTPISAQNRGLCPSSCPDKSYPSIPCQQSTLLKGRDVTSKPGPDYCCLFYCTPRDITTVGPIDLDKFDSTLKLDTPAGIAALITVSLEMFLGAVAVYSVYIAVKSAIELSKADSSDAYTNARKRLSAAVVGLAICGLGLLFLQFVVHLLGLGSISEVFNAIEPFLKGGR